MKNTLKACVFIIMFVTMAFGSINAQHTVFAGQNKSVAFGSKVQLNALPIDAGMWDTIPGMDVYKFYDICYANDTTIFALESKGNLLKSTDSGKTWTSKIVSSTIPIRKIAFYDALNGVACGYNSVIMRTEDGGETWSKTFDGGNFKISKLKYISKNTILAIDLLSTARSYDGGKTWTLFENSSSFYSINDITASPSGTLLAVSEKSKIAILKNYEADSVSISTVPMPLVSAAFIRDETAVVIGRNTIGQVFYDKNMGYSPNIQYFTVDSVYEEIKLSNGTIQKSNGVKIISMLLKSVKFISDNIGYIIGNESTNGYILKTEDGGFSWKIDKKFTGRLITGIDVYNSKVSVCGSNFMATYTSESNENDTYSWSPSVGLSNSQLKNPIATINQPTEYTVTRTHGSVVSTSKVYIDIEALKILSVGNNAIGCTGSVPLEHALTNYTGILPLSYKWTPSTGLSADNIPNPIFTDNQVVAYNGDVTTYTLTVSVPNGESVSKVVTIARNPLKISIGPALNFVCGVSALGNRLGPVYTNYTGTQALSYRWFSGSQTLANDPNPTIPVPTKEITYTLEVSTPEGCFQKTTTKVTVTQPKAYAGSDKTINCGNSVLLDQPSTNNSNSGTITYKWTPATGLSSDTIAQPIASPKITTTYTLTITSSAGCSATDAVVVTVNPLTVNAGADKLTACSTPVQLGPTSSNYSGSGIVKYKWTPAVGLSNDTIANPIATVSSATEYTLTITNENGCTASDLMKVDVSTLEKPKIDFVSVSSATKNVINWTRIANQNVSAYRIYRETNMAENYIKIGDLIDNTSNYFVDTLSAPNVQSNSYKLAVVDVCGNESPMSDSHKTMHLSINQGINGTWNLIWEQYVGFTVSTYNIYRGTTQTDIRQIGSLSGNNSQFTDFTAPSGSVYYQIEAVSSSSAGIPAFGKSLVTSSENGLSITSRSNVATNKSAVDGIFQLKDLSSALSVYPNPASDKFNLVLNFPLTKKTIVKIFDVAGTQIKSELILSNNQTINTDILPNGIYMIVVESDAFIAKQKLVVTKFTLTD